MIVKVLSGDLIFIYVLQDHCSSHGEKNRGETKVDSEKAFKTLLNSPHDFETEEKECSLLLSIVSAPVPHL